MGSNCCSNCCCYSKLCYYSSCYHSNWCYSNYCFLESTRRFYFLADYRNYDFSLLLLNNFVCFRYVVGCFQSSCCLIGRSKRTSFHGLLGDFEVRGRSARSGISSWMVGGWFCCRSRMVEWPYSVSSEQSCCHTCSPNPSSSKYSAADTSENQQSVNALELVVELDDLSEDKNQNGPN